jgi:hypothetical protein
MPVLRKSFMTLDPSTDVPRKLRFVLAKLRKDLIVSFDRCRRDSNPQQRRPV